MLFIPENITPVTDDLIKWAQEGFLLISQFEYDPNTNAFEFIGESAPPTAVPSER